MAFASVKMFGGNSEKKIGNSGRKMSDKIYYVNLIRDLKFHITF